MCLFPKNIGTFDQPEFSNHISRRVRPHNKQWYGRGAKWNEAGCRTGGKTTNKKFPSEVISRRIGDAKFTTYQVSALPTIREVRPGIDRTDADIGGNGRGQYTFNPSPPFRYVVICIVANHRAEIQFTATLARKFDDSQRRWLSRSLCHDTHHAYPRPYHI